MDSVGHHGILGARSYHRVHSLRGSMMPLLLLPLLLIAIFMFGLLMWPIGLWLGFKRGKSRRRAVPWATGFNAWGMLVSTTVFLITAAVTHRWVQDAFRYAVIGLCAGMLIGALSVAITRWERVEKHLYFTPNRWLILLLTLIIAARFGYSLWRGWASWQAGIHHTVWVSQQAPLLGVGGVLIGYQLFYSWALRRRVRR